MFKKYRIAGKKNSQIKGEKQLDSLSDALELLSAKFDELEKDQEKKNKKISEVEKKVNSLESKLGDSVDELEQYSRRNCFVVTWCSRIRRRK